MEPLSIVYAWPFWTFLMVVAVCLTTIKLVRMSSERSDSERVNR